MHQYFNIPYELARKQPALEVHLSITQSKGSYDCNTACNGKRKLPDTTEANVSEIGSRAVIRRGVCGLEKR